MVAGRTHLTTILAPCCRLWVWLTASLMAFLPTVMAMQNNQATVAHVAQGAAAAIGAGLVAAAVPAALNR